MRIVEWIVMHLRIAPLTSETDNNVNILETKRVRLSYYTERLLVLLMCVLILGEGSARKQRQKLVTTLALIKPC